MISELFKQERGRGGYLSTLAPGPTPLISATSVNNGVVGHVDLEPTFKAPCITVERVGGNAFVQYEDFATVPDDLTVLVPHEKVDTIELLYVAAWINQNKWRFSYGRKLTGTRLKKLLTATIGSAPHFQSDMTRFSIAVPAKVSITQPLQQKEQLITEYFELTHGDFHSIDALEPGEISTVSRITYNNGVVGRFAPPEGAVIYPPLTLTVSTTSGEAFLQLEEFIATDNVVVLTPKISNDLYFLLYIQSMINRTKWRYDYGRQCYKTRFAKTKIYIPFDHEANIDMSYIKAEVTSTPGWKEFYSFVSNNISTAKREK